MQELSSFDNEESEKGGYQITASNRFRIHQERIVSFLPVPYYFGWPILAAAYFIISNITILYFEKTVIYIIPTFIIAILMAQQNIMIIWAKNQLDNLGPVLSELIELPKKEMDKFWTFQKSVIIDNRKMFLTGILVNVMSHFADMDDFGYHYNTASSYYFIKCGYYLTHYFMGTGLYLLFSAAISIYFLRELPLSINTLISRNVKVTGFMYSKFTICTIIAYIFWGIFYEVTPNRLSNLSCMIWFSSFAIILLLFFMLPQYWIHLMTNDAKRIYLEGFSAKLRLTTKEALTNPNRQNILCLRAIIEIERQIGSMSEWPFGFYELLHILLIIIIPIMVVIIELAFID